MSNVPDDHIDATAANELEEVNDVQAIPQQTSDPVMAITVALASELQHIYANDQQKLQEMNRSLRAAVKGTGPK